MEGGSKGSHKRLWLIGLLIGVVVVACLAFILRRESPPYRFLQGQRPFYTGYERGRLSIAQIQGYSWEGDFTTLRKQAWEELQPLGFDMDREMRTPGQEMFTKAGELDIYVMQGKSVNKRHMLDLKTDRLDPKITSVTVMIYRPLELNWVNRVRAFLGL